MFTHVTQNFKFYFICFLYSYQDGFQNESILSLPIKEFAGGHASRSVAPSPTITMVE